MEVGNAVVCVLGPAPEIYIFSDKDEAKKFANIGKLQGYKILVGRVDWLEMAKIHTVVWTEKIE